jgi:multidrug efflux pump subunit AcrA (membrane-fusion protein)
VTEPSPLTQPTPVVRPDIAQLSRLLTQTRASSDTERELIKEYLRFAVGLINAAGAVIFTSKGKQLNVADEILSRQVLQLPVDIRQKSAEIAARANAEDRAVHVRPAPDSPVWLVACPAGQGEKRVIVSLILFIGDQQIEPFLIISQLLTSILAAELAHFHSAGTGCFSEALANTLALTLAEHDRDKALLQLGNGLRALTGCSQVAIGTYAVGHKIVLNSLTDVTRIDQRTEFVRCLQKALTECLVQGVMLSNRKLQTVPAEPSSLFQELAGVGNAGLVIGIPLINASGKSTGAIILLWEEQAEPGKAILEIHKNALLAGAVALLQGRQLKKRLQPADSKPGLLSRPSVLTAIVVLFFLSGLIPVPFIIKADCVARPATIRYVVARFDSILKKVIVKPGDRVKAGTVLAELDGNELKLTLAALEADRNKAMKERDSFLAQGNTAAAQIAMLNVQRITGQIDLLNERRQNLHLISPVDGIVLTGDLKRIEGSPVTRGKSLFEVAPLDKMIIEISIAEDDITYIKPGMETRIRFNAFPRTNWHERISRIRPKSEIRFQQNVFIGELVFNNDTGLLRPGMRGNAAIRSGSRPLGWVLLHKPWYSLLRLFGFLS